MLIYDALMKDHDTVLNLLDELVSLKGDSDRREKLIRQIRDELIPHARAEESVFYNSLRSMDEAKGLLGHAYQEHMEAEMKLRWLQLRDKIDADWKETARDLRDAVEHHIREEEEEIFEVARDLLSPEEAQKMGKAFSTLKRKVKQEGMMKTSLRMVANLMPPRFVKVFKKAA